MSTEPAENNQGQLRLKTPDLAERGAGRGLKTLAELLDESDVVDWLLLLSWDYEDIFVQAARDCVLLGSSPETCLLIDFDVLRNYIEKGSTDKVDTLAVDSLFAHSMSKFALPIGAFLELEDYVYHSVPGATRIHHEESVLSRKELILEMARTLGIKDPSKLSDSDVLNDILGRLEKTAVALTRLLAFFTNPNFVGLVAAYDPEDCEKILSILSEAERPYRRGRPRSLVDQRDAVNLAIACGSVRAARAGEETPALNGKRSYLLVSQTKAVLHLVEQAEDANMVGNLCSILGMDRTSVHQAFPVMHPRRIAVAELLGALEKPEVAIRKAVELRDEFRQLGNLLQDRHQVIQSGELRNLYEKALKPFLDQEKEMVGEILQRLRKELISIERSALARIESFRATSLSIDQGRRNQANEEPDEKTTLREKSTSFLRLVDDVISAIETVPGVAYELRTIPQETDHPFDRFIVLQKSDGLEPFPIITGEKFSTKRKPERGGDGYYALRWPITCSEARLIEALEQCVTCTTSPHEPQDLSEPEKHHLPKLVRANSPLWQEGIVISTPDGEYGLSIQAVSSDEGWNVLRLNRLGPLMKMQITPEVRRNGEFITLQIEQIRVNTLFGDLVYEAVNPGTDVVRHFSVISHFDLTDRIITFYEHLGRLCPVRERLLSVLREALQGFPSPAPVGE